MARPRKGPEPMTSTSMRLGDDWPEFRAVTGNAAADNLRAYIAWYLRRDGAKLPARPPAPADPASTGQPERAAS